MVVVVVKNQDQCVARTRQASASIVAIHAYIITVSATETNAFALLATNEPFAVHTIKENKHLK